jgi:hypothetical protein
MAESARYLKVLKGRLHFELEVNLLRKELLFISWTVGNSRFHCEHFRGFFAFDPVRETMNSLMQGSIETDSLKGEACFGESTSVLLF